MTDDPESLLRLRDLHFELALKFEQEYRFGSPDWTWHFKDKTEEALSGALHFENLWYAQITEDKRLAA